jgi:hypothetical protein
MVTLKRIVVATDFGEAADVAFAYGRELARTFGASLDVLHVADNVLARGYAGEGFMAAYPDLQRDVEEAAAKRLDAMVCDEDRAVLKARTAIRVSTSPAAGHRRLRSRSAQRSHYHGHAWSWRDGSSVDGQCGGTGGADRAVSGADGAASRTRVRAAGRARRGREHVR